MKNLWIMLITVTISSHAFAEDANDQANLNEKGIKIFQKMDINNDKFIDMDELKKYHEAFFAGIDKNHNGFITKEEALKEGLTEEEFKKMDANHDNKISIEESFAVETTRFTHDDIDGDGRVSWAEYQEDFKHHPLNTNK